MKLVALVYIIALLMLTSCSVSNPVRYQAGFIGTFDTYIQVVIYASSQQEFGEHFAYVRDIFKHYHALFDIYNNYEDINNLKTVNDNAGIAPVAVDPAVIELILLSRQMYYDTGGALDITLGSVLSIWHDYRMLGIANPEQATIPPYPSLRAARAIGSIDDLIVDEQSGTIFLAHQGMLLDVGATAKGFAAERAAQRLQARGVISALIEAGGDVVTVGRSMTDGGRPWNIGVRHPLTGGIIDAVQLQGLSALTSGGYHRAYTVNGLEYNHIIDPVTLMPAERFASITIIHESAMVGEMLSTALFVLPLADGLTLAQRFGAAAIWVMHDGTVEFNEMYREFSSNLSD